LVDVAISTVDAAQARAHRHPPRLPFALIAGITGHRKEALSAEACEALRRKAG